MSLQPLQRVVLLIALALSCSCGRADGVLAFTFALAPSSQLSVKGEELGSGRAGVSLAQAQGRCTGDVLGRSLQVQVEGLPPVTTSLSDPYYRFVLLIGASPIQPQSVAAGARGVSAAQQLDLGRLTPDPVGRAQLIFTDSSFQLDHVVGAAIEVVVPQGEGEARILRVLQGQVGNLEEDGVEPQAPANAEGPHH